MRIEAAILMMLLVVASIGATRLDHVPAPVVADKVPDVYTPAAMDEQTVSGLIGQRMEDNIENRLLKVDEQAILEGFEHRPGKQAWIGEHAGKFLHAAANAWANSGNLELKAKMDRVAHALIAAQEPDGYLGTYSPDQRWTSWDVWVHKYDLLGLLRYYEVTGDPAALNACRKIGDLLCNTFGDDDPKKRDIIAGDPQMGLASCSVLEPMCYLYRYTGEKRYLDFCYYITRAYNHPSGPHLIDGLLKTGKVFGTANNKSYEMLSNLLGLLELYRLTGDKTFFDAPLAAWKDINERRLFPDGTTSNHEHFRGDDDLPASAGAEVGEGCVTVTWMQLNLSLLRLTDLMDFEDNLEISLYNALLGAENPSTGDVCYFVPLDGQRQPSGGIFCCCSSVPRAFALIPDMIVGTDAPDDVRFNLYVPGKYIVEINGQPVTLDVQTDFPRSGKVTMTVSPPKEMNFTMTLRVPPWTDLLSAKVDDEEFGGRHGKVIIRINREWKAGDQIRVSMDMTTRLIDGGKSYPDCVAVMRGPQLLAAEASQIPGTSLAMVGLAPRSIRTIQPVEGGYNINASVAHLNDKRDEFVTDPITLKLIPFADGSNTQVWFKDKIHLPSGPASLSMGGKESASRPGKNEGSILDSNPETFRSTRDGKIADQDWFAVELPHPAKVGRIVYCHGTCSQFGGWFDTSSSKPRIQVQKLPGGAWEDVATLKDYPATNSTDMPDLQDGQSFAVKLDPPIDCAAIRVIGKASCGIRPKQNCSTCAELDAYAR